MSLKDEWKETGKNLGSAMSDLGKSIGKSADTIVHDKKDEDNVFKNGTWKETGKNLVKAFKGLFKSIVHSADKCINDTNAEQSQAPQPTEEEK